MKHSVFFLTTDLHNEGTNTELFGSQPELETALARIMRARIEDLHPIAEYAAPAAIVLALIDEGKITEAWEVFSNGGGDHYTLKSEEDYYWWGEQEIEIPAPEPLAAKAGARAAWSGSKPQNANEPKFAFNEGQLVSLHCGRPQSVITTVAAEAERILRCLSPAQRSYASHPDRGENRGFGALQQILDMETVLPPIGNEIACLQFRDAVARHVTSLLLREALNHPLA